MRSSPGLHIQARYLSSTVEPFQSRTPRLRQAKGRASAVCLPLPGFVPAALPLDQGGLSASVAPLLTSHKRTSFCVEVPVTSAEPLTSFYTSFLFSFKIKKSQIVSVPQLNESMNSFLIPPPYIWLYLTRFVMCTAYFSSFGGSFQGFLRLFPPLVV